MRNSYILSLFCLFILPAFAAQAASSDWHHIEGGSIRIVTNDTPDPTGLLHGALEIRLRPGWKTYWRDPGASGIPPTVEVLAGTLPVPVTISFPAPALFDDGYAAWAGYDHPIALALTIALPADALSQSRLEAQLFLGVCETICIPVTTTLILDLASNVSDPAHIKLVETAFAALPRQARPGFSAKLISKDTGAMLIEAEAPKGTHILDLFVSGTQTLTLDMPQKIKDGSKTLFRVPIMARSKAASDKELAYTLVTDAGAVSGLISLP